MLSTGRKNPAETRHSHDLAQPALGYLARLYRPKGLETLIEAYIILRSRNRVKNLKLRVAGSQTEADVPFVTRMREPTRYACPS